MGVDIMYKVEVQNKEGKWHAVEIENPYITYKDEDGKEFHPFVSLYDGRDYELFGILAGVRDDTYNQIDDTRGLPKDVSPETKAKHDKYADCYTAETWYSYNELYLWGQNKDNFLPDYYEDLEEDEQRAVRRESEEVRARFNHFATCVLLEGQMAASYVPAQDVRVVMWFDY